ncbi:MAG TPA: class I SAM-dependent methyltransferase [Bacteroidia bacterium]|nr:class I SAM-dependent methyltransferase [Bacteroidia bacterium]HRS59448.1 class I SAM-dependent methyltransferase [Bacteroidia bacterium]HRU69427.1 class I SAM-dependent methyltransferase [Bacteroidia bacterium]
MKIINVSGWKDYELLDSGHFEKLERFGKYTLARPEPQAVWQKSWSEQEWQKMADAWFKRKRANKGEALNPNESGDWIKKSGMPEQWKVSYNYKKMKLTFRLGMTAFKHIGLFPEQAENWNYIYDKLSEYGKGSRFLNLFAYTGGASLAAKAAGADVVHVDSVRQVINWSRENMEYSGLDGIRWVVEDALKFVRREVKRGSKYNGIILDPPAYGRGPEGEKWVLEEQIDEMIHACNKLLIGNQSFMIINLYSVGFSALIAENLVRKYGGREVAAESGELIMTDRNGFVLPLGVFCRFSR